MVRFQKVALAALVSLFLLIFVGAVVRVTGSGMGCPDWPTCWGELIPPSSVEQVDFENLDIEKFREKAAKEGRDPATITIESLREEFNPVHTWIEFLNRLTSMPLGFLTLATFIGGFYQRRKGRKIVFWAAVASFADVLINAVMGARLVHSDLNPVIITTHLALAMLLVFLLVFVAWRGTERPWRLRFEGSAVMLRWIVATLLVITLLEGVLGTQIREVTDVLMRSHYGEARSEWTGELEEQSVYLVHRSLSWVILIGTVAFLFVGSRILKDGLGWLEKGIGGIVGAMMIMGLVLARVGISPVVQVLHVGFSAILVGALCLWLLASSREPV
jgi:cytochrome c oxidase assembly protein subunit 15